MYEGGSSGVMFPPLSVALPRKTRRTPDYALVLDLVRSCVAVGHP